MEKTVKKWMFAAQKPPSSGEFQPPRWLRGGQVRPREQSDPPGQRHGDGEGGEPSHCRVLRKDGFLIGDY